MSHLHTIEFKAEPYPRFESQYVDTDHLQREYKEYKENGISCDLKEAPKYEDTDYEEEPVEENENIYNNLSTTEDFNDKNPGDILESITTSLKSCFNQKFKVSINFDRIYVKWDLSLSGRATDKAVTGIVKSFLPKDSYLVYKNHSITGGVMTCIEPTVERCEKAKEIVLSVFENTYVPEYRTPDNYKFVFNDDIGHCYEAEARYVWLLNNGELSYDLEDEPTGGLEVESEKLSNAPVDVPVFEPTIKLDTTITKTEKCVEHPQLTTKTKIHRNHKTVGMVNNKIKMALFR